MNVGEERGSKTPERRKHRTSETPLPDPLRRREEAKRALEAARRKLADDAAKAKIAEAAEAAKKAAKAAEDAKRAAAKAAEDAKRNNKGGR